MNLFAHDEPRVGLEIARGDWAARVVQPRRDVERLDKPEAAQRALRERVLIEKQRRLKVVVREVPHVDVGQTAAEVAAHGCRLPEQPAQPEALYLAVKLGYNVIVLRLQGQRR